MFCQILKVKYRVKSKTQFEILCFVNKAQALLLFTCVLLIEVSIKCCFLLLMILFMNTLNQFTFFAMSHFVKEMVIPYFTLL